MYQEGIYLPDAATRWMGSIAMDDNGSIGMGYIKTDASAGIYPGLYYTGRRSCDPLGTLPITESLVIAGTGSQTGVNRVGDYAQLSMDPDGITFGIPVNTWADYRRIGCPNTYLLVPIAKLFECRCCIHCTDKWL